MPSTKPVKITFYCKVEREILEINEFYKQDIKILEALGFKVIITNKWYKIDLESKLIFVWWWTYAFIPVTIAKIFNKKTIITGTFNYKCPQADNDFYRRNILERMLIKYSFNNTDINLMVSKNEYNQLANDWQPNNMKYSPHIVDTNIYANGKFSERENNLIFTLSWLSISNVDRKCIVEIIDAAKLVHAENQEIKFVIGGRDGDAVSFLKMKIKEENLHFINLVGELTLNEKLKYLQTCTIYLQPSKYEGFGLAIAEAMSCGAPVISTDVGEVKNVTGDTGILLETCKPELISQEILSLVEDNQLRQSLSLKASKRIRSNFNYDRRKRDIEIIVASLMNK